MTFVEYITQPSGFGKTRWPVAIMIHLFGALAVYYTYKQSWWALLGLAPVVLLWYGTWMNYTKRWV